MKSIKNIVLVIALFSSFWPAFAKVINIPNTEVTFEAPEGFAPLSPEMMALKWPSNRAPAFAVGTATGSTTIAYDLKSNFIPQNELPDALKFFTQVFERIVPGIVWKKKEVIPLSGQNWLLLEMSSNAIDTDIHNIILITGYKGKLLMFNFNSTKEDFLKYENVLRQSLQSIKLTE